jgi:hypothetical protein
MDIKEAKAVLENLAFQRENNATFYTFKDSGKWSYEGRGYLSDAVFRECFSGHARREQILKDNGGLCPGMSTAGRDLIMVVIPDESHDTGFPLLLHPEIRA